MKKFSNTIQSEIASQINYLQNKIVEAETNLSKDFLYYFEWVSEELFKHKFKINELQFKLEFILNIEDEALVIEECKIIIKSYERYLNSEHNIRSNSTGTLHRETSTWKYQSILELKNLFVNLLEY
ncbi:hypothetical protein UFOVP595_25 [uncultured Caudovirales phage]|jgi:hypothetical protein|uniref:Uncharacterized protein n=1 Tax=uncultured Caudovirales phage TaxID=2100421 RepID=A0A6J5N052_9CAUD|nr:hypothetical protein UFOVP595_25 [uncultured Caudovirales phage]